MPAETPPEVAWIFDLQREGVWVLLCARCNRPVGSRPERAGEPTQAELSRLLCPRCGTTGGVRVQFVQA